MAINLSYVTTIDDTSSQTTYTFTNASIGAAAADRVVIAVVFLDNASNAKSTFSGMTIGGVSTLGTINDDTGNGRNIMMGWQPFAFGTTATIAVTVSPASSRCALAIYRLTGAASPEPSGNDNSHVTAGVHTATFDVPNNGAVLAALVLDTSGQTSTWSGVTEDLDTSFGAGTQKSSGHTITSSAAVGYVVSATHTSGEGALVAAVWDEYVAPPASIYFGASHIGWIPSDLPGLLAWYDASNGVYFDAGTTLAANGATVQQWNDISGSGYNLSQATSGKRPIYLATGYSSRPTVDFTGAVANTYMETGTNAFGLDSPTVSAFAVTQMQSAVSDNGRLVSFIANGRTLDYDNINSFNMGKEATFTQFKAEANAVSYNITSISLDTNYRFGAVFDENQDVSTYINGVGSTTATVIAWDFGFTVGNGTFRIGSDTRAIKNWDGPVSEAVVYSSALSPSDVIYLDNYFKAKWGLS